MFVSIPTRKRDVTALDRMTNLNSVIHFVLMTHHLLMPHPLTSSHPGSDLSLTGISGCCQLYSLHLHMRLNNTGLNSKIYSPPFETVRFTYSDSPSAVHATDQVWQSLHFEAGHLSHIAGLQE